MAHRVNASARLALSIGSLLVAAGPVAGHPRVLWPNGGEVLEAGSTVTITWRIDIQHSTLNWDLWYSATGPRGPWIVIEMDLPPGSTAVGSVHEYEWAVPAVITDQGRIRVRQDNVGTNYLDISDGNFSIVEPTCYADCDGNGSLDIFDFLCFQNAFVRGDPYACDCNITPTPVCDIFDFLCFQNAFVAGCP